MRLIHCNTLKFQDNPILRFGQKSALQLSLFWRYANFSKFMRTMPRSMTSAFQCEYCQCFTFKRCDKFKLKCTSHAGMHSARYFGNSECCNADFWPEKKFSDFFTVIFLLLALLAPLTEGKRDFRTLYILQQGPITDF